MSSRTEPLSAYVHGVSSLIPCLLDLDVTDSFISLLMHMFDCYIDNAHISITVVSVSI